MLVNEKKIFSKKFLKVLEQIARKELEFSDVNKPPYCTGIFHQPKRPRKKIVRGS
jgi:cyclic lactone autoinducer peptide